MGRPIDWHSVARCIQIDPSKRSKEVWWNWYAIRINYASKDNRWRNCRLTIRIKTWNTKSKRIVYETNCPSRNQPSTNLTSVIELKEPGVVWCDYIREGYYEGSKAGWKETRIRNKRDIRGSCTIAALLAAVSIVWPWGLNRDSGWSRVGRFASYQQGYAYRI